MSWPPTPPRKTGWYAVLIFSGVGGIPSAEAFGNAVLTQQQNVHPTGIPSAQAVGMPTVSYLQGISPAGILTAEAFGGSVLNPGATGVSPLGIPSSEALGEPVMSTGNNLVTTGIPSSEAFGTATMSPGPIGFQPTGIPTAEAFGDLRIARAVSPGGIVSEEAFGAIQVNLTIHPLGVPSGETFGTAAVTGGIQNLSPVGIDSAEAFGGSQVNPGPIAISPLGIGSGELFGSPSLTTGAVNLAPTGLASAEAFGTALLGLSITPTGIVSEETFGPPIVEGLPPFDPIEYVGSNTAFSGFNLSMPTHQAGDLLLAFIYDLNNNAVPNSSTAGWTEIAWANGNNNSYSVLAQFATSSSTPQLVMDTSQSRMVQVYRNVGSIGTIAEGFGSTGLTLVHPAVSLTQTNGSSWVVRFAGKRASNATVSTTTPAGYTHRTTANGTNNAGIDTNASVASSPSVNQVVTGNSGAYLTIGIELVAG